MASAKRVIIEQREHVTIIDHPDGEFGRVHPVQKWYEIIEPKSGTVVFSAKTKATIVRWLKRNNRKSMYGF